MHLRTAAASTSGARKRVNEDSCCILQAESDVGPLCLVVVCDGVGGLAKGEVASTHVAHRFAHWFESSLPTYLAYNSEDGVVDVAGVERVWSELLRKANGRLLEYGDEVAHGRAGTTVSALFLCQDQALTCQVGDSRVYRLRDGKLETLTKDQTLVQRKYETGLLTREEAENSSERNVILQAVGSQAVVDPVFSLSDVQDDDVFAVCCDGFYHTVSYDELVALLDACAHADDDAMRALLEDALEERMARGEKDNITIACCSNRLPDAASDDEPTSVMDVPGAADNETEAQNEQPLAVDDGLTVVLDDGQVKGDAEADDAATFVLDEVSVAEADDAPTCVFDDDSAAGAVEADDAATSLLETPPLPRGGRRAHHGALGRLHGRMGPRRRFRRRFAGRRFSR